MRAFTSIPSIKLLLVFSLFLVFGCAQNAHTVKDDQPDAVGMATLRDITVTGEGTAARLEILANKPLTYAYYSLKEPFRTVIDLSQTAPGNVEIPKLDGSSVIQKISMDTNELSSGSLVRITIETKEDVSFASVPDLTDKTKLAFTITAQQKLEPARQTEASALPATKLKDDNAAVPAEKPAVIAASDETKAVAVNKPSVEVADSLITNGPLAVTNIDVVSDGIVIRTGGPVPNFKYFTLAKPQRLAIDIFNVKNALTSKTVALNSHGIVSARIGTYPDKVRVVFDATGRTLPQFKLEKAESGIKVVLTTPGQAAVPEKTATNQPQASASKAQPTASPSVEAIDFKVVDGFSRIAVTAGDGCVLDGPLKTRDGLVMTFTKCTLPARLQRPFDTSAFASVVKRVTPYMTRVKGRQDVKILIALREDAPYSLKREGAVVNLDIKNPEPFSTPQLVSGKEQAVPVVASGPADAVQKSVPEKSKLQNPAIEKKYDKKIYTGRRVTLEFVDADIRKIFQLIAEVSNYNILVGDDVTGTISIKLVNVPWDQALDVILDTKGLGMKKKDNIIVIRPLGKITSLADEEMAAQKAFEKTLELRTRIFDVNYASVSDIAGQFNVYKSERGTISVDARTNRVIVNDIAPRIDKMAELLKNLDIPEKQVLIEARIVEATSTFTQDLGIQWGIHYRDGSASLLGINSLDTGFGGLITNLAPSNGFQPAGTAGGAMGLSFGKLTSNVQIDLRLSAAAENGEVKIISTPKVVTLNNKAAKISQGQMIPYSTVSAEGTKTEFIEAALTLEVTPHITSDGGVSMKIKATNNSAGSAATGVAPPINKKEATTELLVLNGETTVIGGIYVDSDNTTDSGVPYLKDIPLLGWLFKSTNQKKTKTELLIFITPKIVS